uniref:DNA polymerase alpha subunit B n=2 Tax=Aceria tosichella TaxID=561515 RepID=A0A6G1SED0_9ACAR
MEHMRHVQVAATKNMFDVLIDRHAEAYLEAYPEVKEFSDFERSGTGHYYIGMIWADDNEKPLVESTKLRGSLSLTNNSLVELDFSAIDSQQSFFPGQIIAFLADPFTKRQLTTRKLLDPMRIAPRLKTITTDDTIRLLVAAGPFMRPEQDDWSLFDNIITSIKENNATHVILMGPFVDMENKLIGSKYDLNWRTCFDKLVEGPFDYACDVYLVPSSRDVLPNYLSATYFYPSPRLEFEIRVKEKIHPKCNITSVSDPAQIDLGGIYLDVTSAEVLLHLNKCSTFINKQGSVFASLYRHLISLGIYPIYPSPTDIAIDYPKLMKHIQLDRLGPHILTIPTRFKTSVVPVDDRLVVAVQKCSTTKQVVLVEIPKIEGTSETPINSVVHANYTHKIINLCPAIKTEEDDQASSMTPLESTTTTSQGSDTASLSTQATLIESQ